MLRGLIGCLLLMLASLAYSSEVYKDPRKTIIVDDQNPEFLIEMTSNRTTGYAWFLLGDYNEHLISLEKHTYTAPANTENKVGQPGIESWFFRVLPPAFTGPHALELEFVHAQPWNIEDGERIVYRLVTTDTSGLSTKNS